MLPTKRQKQSEDDVEDHDSIDNEHEEGASASGSADEPMSSQEGSDTGTEDEIANAQLPAKSKKTLKRKHRATSPSRFGAALQSLLTTDAPSTLPLSLKPSAARKRKDEKLEVKAKKVLEGEKKDREETNHIKDVIGGWGGEGERALRKVAQRGVVKLFNAIQQSQSAAVTVEKELKASRGSGKPSLPAPVIDSNSRRKKDVKAQTVTRQEKSTPLGQDDFLDLIRSGGIVSKK